jgi:hypothetical protein
MGVNGNEIADQLARQGPSLPLRGPESAFGISVKDASGVIRDWTSRKHEEYWKSIHTQRQAKGILKRPSAKTMRKLLDLSRNQVRIMTGLLTGHCHLKEHHLKLRLVDSLVCDRCKQASETASHFLCECVALARLRFRQLGHHFLKPGDFADISITKLLNSVPSVGLLNA